ncbi:head GIN domain-containing protein [Hymenobacter chitinivorans]|uniref:Putative autotransporter adhesin-like protein n=1 Tax=Hymenobacter chitinivorans DSM 11115 TaxID=1121954 RepID=A0A2M9BP24_9BACT|nr:head GIN domain-containing protein [Hymenobacter chitinivorans]PJJ59687.1 putative autotransporter adhesin-like protein [Hymenobacter chitinivorans DSM 11115]
MFRSTIWPQVKRPCRVLRVGAFAAGALLLGGCGEGHETDCLKSTGKVVTERRELASFEVITAYDNVDVTLVQDAETYAEVRAGKNLQEDIKLRVEHGELVIRNTSRCNWVRTYDTPREVTLHLPRIHDLFVRGYGNLRTAGNFRADTLFCHLVGAGDIDLDITSQYLNMDMYELGDFRLRGRADDFHLLIGGNGSLYASGLQSRECYFTFNHDSNGDAHVTTTNYLGGTHAGTGTLFYQGTPLSTGISLTGKGKVVNN